jgi:hypothetical protein
MLMGKFFPRVFVDENGGGIDHVVFAVEEGDGDVDGVREGAEDLVRPSRSL